MKHVPGPRILRCTSCTDFSIHDIILVDAGQFHLSLDTCTNGEIYNMIIHGGYEGGLDGIDVWGTNICKDGIFPFSRQQALTTAFRDSRHRSVEQGCKCTDNAPGLGSLDC
jgi:hypothetical protein